MRMYLFPWLSIISVAAMEYPWIFMIYRYDATDAFDRQFNNEPRLFEQLL